MLKPIDISNEYSKEYRKKIGFGNQNNTKNFLGAKDTVPAIDREYLKNLNCRLSEMVDRLNLVVAPTVKVDDLAAFKKKYIDEVFAIMDGSGILPLLNNQGRRPEQVYFSWMRGFVVSNYFLKALGSIFGVDASRIATIGEDDFRSVETFKRAPKADLEIGLETSEKVRIEMQSGFAGINDIKKHKVDEAKSVFAESGIHTVAIHFDIYNGKVAFVKLDEINDSDVNWVKREQMEGQMVFNIDEKYFVWKLTEDPEKYEEIIAH
jgi:hypothetical protein